MQKSLVALVVFLLPLVSFAEDYKCEFLDNETGATGSAEAIENADGKYTLRLAIDVDGAKSGGDSKEAVEALEADDEAGIMLYWANYAVAHNGEAPVPLEEVKSVKGMRYAEEEQGETMEATYLILRDAEGKTLDQAVILNGFPIACKR